MIKGLPKEINIKPPRFMVNLYESYSRLPEEKKHKMEIAFLLFVYLGSILAYAIIGMGGKLITVYPDEMLYYNIARSIFNGDELVVNQYYYGFKKIAYSILISPFFAIGNGELRLTVIWLFNAVVILSSVFPAWLITKELEMPRHWRFFAVFITAVFPEMMRSMGFMAENLYFPLTMWFMLLWLKNAKKPKISYTLLLALLCLAMYYCKEVALAFPVSWIGFELCYPFVAFFTDKKENRRSLKTYFSRKRLLSSIAVAAVFAVLAVSVSLIFFRDTQVTYEITDNTSQLTDPDILVFMLRTFLYYIAGVILSVLIVPIFYPLIHFRKLPDSSRRLYCFLIIFVMVMMAVVVYTIAINEDIRYRSIALPRLHLRYIAGCGLLLFFPFLKSLQKAYDEPEPKKKHVWALSLSVTLYVCLFFVGIRTLGVDQYALWWFAQMSNGMSIYNLDNSNPTMVVITALILLSFMLMHLISTSTFSWLYTNNYKRLAKGAFSVITLIAMISSNIFLNDMRYASMPGKSVINDAIKINEYLSAQSEAPSVLFVSPKDKPEQPLCIFETYVDCDRNIYFSSPSIMEQEKDYSVKVSEVEITFPGGGDCHPANEFEYIVIPAYSLSRYSVFFTNVEIIPEISGENYNVYKNLDTHTLNFGENPNYKPFVFEGAESWNEIL